MVEFDLVQKQEGKTVFFVYPRSMPPQEIPPHLDKPPVFYNPKQELNRDLSVLAFSGFFSSTSRGLSFCDAFTGCGIRALRYAKEVPHVQEVIASDINPKAVSLAKHNVKYANLSQKIKVVQKHANLLFLERFSNAAEVQRFDLIDIDPFGSPVPYMHAALSAISRRGSLIALTATDMPALCGVYPKVSYRKYSGWSIRTPFSHELALRLLIGAFARAAIMVDKGIQVRFAYYADHYTRAIVEPRPTASLANRTLSEMGYAYYCVKCHSRGIISIKANEAPHGICDICGGERTLAGPLFVGTLFDITLLRRMLKLSNDQPLGTLDRVKKILRTQVAEAKGPPLYYNIHKICKGYSFSIPPIDLITEALRANGFFASRTHFNPTSIRTNAPITDVLDTIKKVKK